MVVVRLGEDFWQIRNTDHWITWGPVSRFKVLAVFGYYWNIALAYLGELKRGA